MFDSDCRKIEQDCFKCWHEYLQYTDDHGSYPTLMYEGGPKLRPLQYSGVYFLPYAVEVS